MLTSDIPDWCCVEAGLTFDPATPPTAEDFAQMMSVSPISLAPKVRRTKLFFYVQEPLHRPSLLRRVKFVRNLKTVATF